MFLELRHLRTLAMIKECGNLASAAQRLHLTQSALSHQIKALEHYYEHQLFTRKSKPLHFTPLGNALLELAAEVLPKVEACERRLRHLSGGNQGRLHLAMECHSCFEWLMPTMDVFRCHWQLVEMDISVGFAFDPISALQTAQVDLVVTSDVQNLQDISYSALFDYQLLLAMHHDNPLAAKKTISASDLSAQTLITYPVETARLDVYRNLLQPNKVQVANRRTAELTAMILQLVASNRGVAALPSWVLSDYLERDYVTARPFAAQNGMWGTLYAAIRKSDQNLAYMQAFIKQAKITAFEVLTGIKSAKINN